MYTYTYIHTYIHIYMYIYIIHVMHTHPNAVYDVYYFIGIPQIDHSTLHLVMKLISGRGSIQIYN